MMHRRRVGGSVAREGGGVAGVLADIRERFGERKRKVLQLHCKPHMSKYDSVRTYP